MGVIFSLRKLRRVGVCVLLELGNGTVGRGAGLVTGEAVGRDT